MDKQVSIKEIQSRIQAIDVEINEKLKLVKNEYNKRKKEYENVEELSMGDKLTIANMNAISYKNMQDCINARIDLTKLYASLVKNQNVGGIVEAAVSNQTISSKDIEAARELLRSRNKDVDKP